MKILKISKPHCIPCQNVENFLQDNHVVFEEIDIYKDDALLEKYQLLIPVVKANGKELNCEQINIASLENIIKKS